MYSSFTQSELTRIQPDYLTRSDQVTASGWVQMNSFLTRSTRNSIGLIRTRKCPLIQLIMMPIPHLNPILFNSNAFQLPIGKHTIKEANLNEKWSHLAWAAIVTLWVLQLCRDWTIPEPHWDLGGSFPCKF